MRRHLLTAALLLAATPAPGQVAQSDAARKLNEAGKVACAYTGLTKDNWPVLIALVKNGLNAKTNAEKFQFDKIVDQVERCRKTYGWGNKSKNIAMKYFSGRALRSNATYELKKHGVTDDALLAIVARYDAPTRAQVASYQMGQAATQTAIETLAAMGITLDKVPEAERADFGRLLGQGIVGLVIEQDAAAEFDKG